jgi:methionine synthase II (cobalamin-independent)
MGKKVDKNVTIEELVIQFPESVKFLMDKGIKCIACGEPVWGTLEENAKEKGMDDQTIEQVVEELNEKIVKQPGKEEE